MNFNFLVICNLTMDNSDQKFDTFFNQQAAGQIPYCQNFYVLDGPMQDGGAAVKLVTPTEQTVEQAKSELKENIMKMKPRRKQLKPKKRLQKKQVTKQRGRGMKASKRHQKGGRKKKATTKRRKAAKK